jgi:hypothetical protein
VHIQLYHIYACLNCLSFYIDLVPGAEPGGAGAWPPLMLQETTNLHCENQKISTKSVKLVDFNLKFGNLAPLMSNWPPQCLNPGYAPDNKQTIICITMIWREWDMINNANLTVIWSQSFEKSKSVKDLFLGGKFYVPFCSCFLFLNQSISVYLLQSIWFYTISN